MNYLCPSCRGLLNVNQTIVFSAKTKKGKVGLILLSPEIGNYTIMKHLDFTYKEGEHIDFYCPICHANLTAKGVNNNLAKITMIAENKEEYDILFSQIAGEKCTYKVRDKYIESSAGDSSDVYLNFFSLVNLK